MTELPSSWVEARLGSLGRWVGGGTPSKREPRYWNAGTIPWVSPKDMKSFRITGAQDAITSAAVEGSATQLVPAGAVLIVIRSGILRHTLPVGTTSLPVCVNQDLKAVIPARGVLPTFIAYALVAFGGDILRTCSKDGTTVQSIEFPALLDYSVPLPPLAEQQRIVEAIEEQFSRLDAGVASLRRAQRNLRRMRESVLTALLPREPVSKLRDYLREPLRNGKSLRASRDGAVRILTLSAVTEGEFSERNTKLVDANGSAIGDLWLEPGDVLIERSNTPELVGTTRLYNGEPRWAIFPDLLIRARFHGGLSPQYAELALQSRPLRRYFQSRAKGLSGSMPKIDQGTIETAPLAVPPLPEQHRIVAEVERQFSILDAMEAAVDAGLKRAERLREAVLREAFAGRLVPQDANDEPASVLLERIKADRGVAAK